MKEVIYFLDDSLSSERFQQNTLILPAISVGNVGQLTCDLLISTLKLTKIGYFQPECFVPLIGNNPFSTEEENEQIISLSSEVFQDEEKKLTVIQIRSPLIKGKKEFFCKSLLEWYQKCNFKELIILSTCHSYERTDEQLLGSPFRFLLSPDLEYEMEVFSEYKWRQLEERNVGHGDRSLFLPGGGFAKSLYLDCCSKNIPVAVLLLFCAEGDNIPEAFTLVSYLNQWKRFVSDTVEWKPPSSWKHLFGNQPPSELF